MNCGRWTMAAAVAIGVGVGAATGVALDDMATGAGIGAAIFIVFWLAGGRQQS